MQHRNSARTARLLTLIEICHNLSNMKQRLPLQPLHINILFIVQIKIQKEINNARNWEQSNISASENAKTLKHVFKYNEEVNEKKNEKTKHYMAGIQRS